MSMIPAFNISLNNPILQGLVAVGRFDGVHAALACGTATDHVVVHSPYASRELVSATASSSDDVIAANATDLKHLSVNQRVTALATGDLHQDPPLGSLLYEDLDDDSGYGQSTKPKKPDHRDVLLVGMQTNLLAYDVEENTDVFYKDVPDGVSAVACGRMSAASPPVAITGGHCSLQGFDRSGNEVFWTVAGDNISALTFRDQPIALVGAGGTVNVPGTATLASSAPARAQQLIVASEDYEIRIYEQNDVVVQANETDVVSALTPIRGSLFGYGLRNGTIGVYDNGQRLWSTKSKHTITALTAFDLDGDGIPELISGWNNGKIEARSDRSSQVIYKDKFSAPIAGIVSADYRTDGKTELICCTTDGQIRGYLTVGEETKAAVIEDTVNERILAELNAAKQDLMTELRGYENNLKEFKTGKLGAGVVPPDTRLTLSLQPSAQLGALVLALSTNNDTLIKVVMIFNDTIFEDESLLVHPAKPSSACSVLLRPLKQVDTVLNVKVVVGHRSSTQDHVFEVTQRLPRFACYVDTPLRDLPVPRSKVTCTLSERSSRVANWVQNSFLVEEKTLSAANTGDTLSFGFIGVFDRAPVVLRFSGGQFDICTDSMELAGDILQDLASFLNIHDLQSVADFPDEFDAFAETLRCVEEFNAVRIKMSGEMADSSNIVKSLVIKAEDARMLNHMPQMRQAYNELSEMNGNLIGEYTKRANNHQQLLASLKEVNKMIQKAAKLRVGRHKAAVVTACRAAVKGNNMQSLFKIIRVGQSTA